MFAKKLERSCFLLAMLFSFEVAAYGGGNTGSGFEASGPYSTQRESGGSSCTVHRPRDLEGDHGVILWGNGTGTTPTSYRALLSHWASWGFIVVAANTTNAGTGRAMLSCLDWLQRSSLAPYADLSKVGASGHSQGGGGAIMAGADRRVTVTAPIQGYTIGLGHSSRSHSQQNFVGSNCTYCRSSAWDVQSKQF